MSNKLAFITGATGFIGAATALATLKAGYRLRVSVRKEEQIAKLEHLFSSYTDKVNFVVVPDITAPNAFAKVLQDVDYILHLASPVPGKDDQKAMFKAAQEGTLNILRDATNFPKIQKVVITSSILALQPVHGVPEGGVVKEETDWDLSVDTEADFSSMHPFQVYGASKLLANQATWEFVDSEKPHYAVVSIHPSLVYGYNPLQQSAEELGPGSSNGMLFSSIMNGADADFYLNCVYIGDVADAHIKALNPDVKAGSSYLISGKPFTSADVVEILQKHYPEVSYKLVPKSSSTASKTDTSKAEKELGIRWAEPEKLVREVMDQQLAFLK